MRLFIRLLSCASLILCIGSLLVGCTITDPTDAESINQTTETNSEDDHYKSWLNSSLEELIGFETQLDTFYIELLSMSSNDAVKISAMHEKINKFYTDTVNLIEDVKSENVKAELKNIRSEARAQAKSLNDMAKDAANNKWDDFNKSNDLYLSFRDSVIKNIENLLSEKDSLISYSVVTLFNESFDTDLTLTRNVLSEGATSLDDISNKITSLYGETSIKEIALDNGQLLIEIIDDSVGNTYEFDKLGQPTFISNYTEIIADYLMSDVNVVNFSIYSSDGKLKSSISLETNQLIDSAVGKYWDSMYIEDKVQLGEYFNEH